MLRFFRKSALLSGIVLLPILAGCASDSEARDQNEQSKAGAPAALPPPESDPAPKKADLPDLPQGAGPMDDDAPEEFSRTKSGLYYRILRKSTGRKPHSVDRVVAHYKGWLNSGKQFDSSYDRGEPTEFGLRNVIAGWTEGLQLVGVGGMIELEVPPRLAYGVHGPPGIPPNSTLHFLVELKEIK